MHHEAWGEALPGDNMVFNVKNVSVKDVHCGNVAGDSKNDPPMEAVLAKHLCWVVTQLTLLASFPSWKRRLMIILGKKLEDGLKFLKYGDAAIVKVVPGKAMCVESISN